MGLGLCKCCSHCSWTKHDQITLSKKHFGILLLGLMSAGKTEVGLILSKKTRIQFEPTNGVQYYEISLRNIKMSVTEIGGNEEMRKLWHHYYVKAVGLIYCYDMSASSVELEDSFRLLNKIASHPFMKGKPILLVATKSDLTNDTVQLYDIENSFALEDFAKRNSSLLKSIHFNPLDPSCLWSGIDWLADFLQLNYKYLEARINNDEAISTAKPSKKTNRFSITCRRPKTAPAIITPVRISTSPSYNIFRIQHSERDPESTTSGTKKNNCT